MRRRPPRSTLFPYTTLFRSGQVYPGKQVPAVLGLRILEASLEARRPGQEPAEIRRHLAPAPRRTAPDRALYRVGRVRQSRTDQPVKEHGLGGRPESRARGVHVVPERGGRHSPSGAPDRSLFAHRGLPREEPLAGGLRRSRSAHGIDRDRARAAPCKESGGVAIATAHGRPYGQIDSLGRGISSGTPAKLAAGRGAAAGFPTW